MFDTQIISDQTHFQNLRKEWNELLQESCTNTIFLTWEWLYAWWSVFGNGSNLFIITVRNGDGKLKGIAPLQIRRTRYYGIPVKEVAFIGTGISDRQNFIIAHGDEIVSGKIAAVISENHDKWDIMRLEEVPEESWLLARDAFGNLAVEWEVCSSSPYLKLEGDWQNYFKTLSKNFKRDLKRKETRMARLGKCEYCFNVNHNYNEELLVDVMTRIDSKSRKKDSNTTFYSIEDNRKFILELFRLSQEQNWLDFSSVNMDGTLIGYLLGFQYNNIYIGYNMAFSEDFHEASPGKLLLHEKLKWCFSNSSNITEFNFSRGASYIKALWAAEARKQFRMVFFKRSLYPQLIRFIVFYIRPAVKTLLRREKSPQENK